MVDLPDDGSPRSITFFDGMALEEDTESKIEDHRFCSGDAGLESIIGC
jgi:hypothetical protein